MPCRKDSQYNTKLWLAKCSNKEPLRNCVGSMTPSPVASSVVGLSGSGRRISARQYWRCKFHGIPHKIYGTKNRLTMVSPQTEKKLSFVYEYYVSAEFSRQNPSTHLELRFAFVPVDRGIDALAEVPEVTHSAMDESRWEFSRRFDNYKFNSIVEFWTFPRPWDGYASLSKKFVRETLFLMVLTSVIL